MKSRWVVFKRQIHKVNPAIFLSLIVMYILSTVEIICRWVVTRSAFIDHGDTSNTISLYLLEPPLWEAVLAAVVFSINTLIADCILVWRCWTVWNRNWLIVALPLLSTLVGAALGFKSIQEQAAYVLNPNLDRAKFINFATPYFGLSLATTCVATLLIIFRIVTMTERATRKSRGYVRLIEIIVESALLYSVALAVLLPYLVRNSADSAYPQAVVAQITGMAPTLIVARISLGFARPEETWQSPTTSLHISGRLAPPASSIALTGMNDFGSSTEATQSNQFEK
ncbi:hypothetical protein DFH07DRAFT_950456 [Mycena maculata]|uniref:Uncharacterized protein n=1 Tax=Mycena maculata TaxID=230809 RepID=A0AAD7K6L0_9AGAR|nr:hypothetical protein DFH07DRAFT_950456 [Mycena maculata]